MQLFMNWKNVLKKCKSKHVTFNENKKQILSSSNPHQVPCFWHIFWHSIWYIFGDSLWLRSGGESGGEHLDPELAVEDAFIQKRFYTEKHVNKEACTQRIMYTKKLLHSSS